MPLLKTLLSIHKSVKVRPTKYFLLLLGAIVSLFLQAYMHNYNIVYIMMFFITAIAGTSTLYGMFNLHPIRIEFLSNERFFAGETSSFALLICNDADYACYDLNFAYDVHAKKIEIMKAHETSPLHFSTTFSLRGKTVIDKIRLTSLFPLPHESKSKLFSLDAEILVYPRPQGVSLFSYFSKNLSSHGDISDFDTVARYNEGENIALIHWASLAKNNTLMSKKFLYEQKKETLHFDFKTLGGETEQKLSQLCLWVLECERYDFHFTLELEHEILDSKRMDTDAILAKLALY